MRDFPLFTTQQGVASLTLSQIPFTKKAYIRIQSSLEPEAFLQECVSFCSACGAEEVFAAGHAICENYPLHTSILRMQVPIEGIGDTDAALFPVTEQTLEEWRTIYNQKVRNVPNGAWMTVKMANTLLKSGEGYFVHKNGDLLGIGQVSGAQIHWVASLKPGAGADVVRALCHAVSAETVYLEVASENTKAVSLYKNLGFCVAQEISKWYRVK